MCENMHRVGAWDPISAPTQNLGKAGNTLVAPMLSEVKKNDYGLLVARQLSSRFN